MLAIRIHGEVSLTASRARTRVLALLRRRRDQASKACEEQSHPIRQCKSLFLNDFLLK